MKTVSTLLIAAAALVVATAEGYEPAPVPMTTPWGEKVTPENVWREYPRPQLVRRNWTCLNGLWRYAVQPANAAGFPEKWEGEILVPFAIESSLSGVGRALTPKDSLWYRRMFTADIARGERLILNFEQADWRTHVFVNGVEAGIPHEGGWTPFSYDVTSLVKKGENELVVMVWDPTDEFLVASGKQTLHPNPIFYTAWSGLTGTVWLETVPQTHVASYFVSTDLDQGVVRIGLDVRGEVCRAAASVEVMRDGRTVASGTFGDLAHPLSLKLPRPLSSWSPEKPDLYGLRITLSDGESGAKDVVKGYFGLRKIEVRKDERGVPRIYFNNRPRYLAGTLDQGWWPESLLTPPSEEAMRFDIEALKKMGFDMMRKHIKVEPRRYYHLCDTLGIMVMQDMPSGKGDVVQRYGYYRRELEEVVETLRNSPSVVCWIPYNETWGQPGAFLTRQSLLWLRRTDPTRLVDGASGANDFEGGELWTKPYGRTKHMPEGVEEAGDLVDKHDYRPRPSLLPLNARRASFMGEYGAGDVFVRGHVWTKKIRDDEPRADLKRMEEKVFDLLNYMTMLARKGGVGSVYTQTVDVENKVNGFLTYDRRVWKYDAAKIREANNNLRKAYFEGMGGIVTNTVFARLSQNPNAWAYSFEEPKGDWTSSGYDDSAWRRSAGGIGSAGSARNNPKVRIATLWTTDALWLRRRFTLSEIPAKFYSAIFNTYHDEDCEIYLNGKLLLTLPGWNRDWTTDAFDAKTFLKFAKKGENVLAVKVVQKGGEQFFDTELLLECGK